MIRRVQVGSTIVCALLFCGLLLLPLSVTHPDWMVFQKYMTLLGWTYVALPLALVTTWVGLFSAKPDELPPRNRLAFLAGLAAVWAAYLLAAMNAVVVTHGNVPLTSSLPSRMETLFDTGGLVACGLALLLSFFGKGQARTSVAVSSICTASLFFFSLLPALA